MMMERFILCVLCLSGWHIFSTSLVHQYHYVADPMNWTEAQTYCRQKHTDLATIENTEEMNKLISTVSSSGNSSMVWIGLYTEINWRWSDGYTGIRHRYRQWRINEPDFLFNTEFCVVTGTINDPWWDDDCLLRYPIICNNGTQHQPIFIKVEQSVNWSSAQRYCRENFLDLATVRNNNESLEIQAMVLQGWAWIGLFRDPHIHWSDGSGYSFKYWYTGPKPLGSMSVACGVADLQRSGRWTLSPCETRLPFACYSTPVKQQTVKLKIKLEDSSVDLNDPTVKADIMKKLQDRLKQNGVSGVTLKWREQPDGKVFHKERKSSKKQKCQNTEF